ncbi:Electron transfer flavoprotein subunit alpha [Actinobaculum suis]|uniref:Electron transfer flavoprotein subunit alpha n=1 Tax=Actinobaculum suis TaxID=1657 RepID=A0A7Z8Y8S6_9ACTO|nr:electron transfer flavoprotein subunit alpha/FixB family protein [Actinobaculum suis]VDG76050.1 Electron transfer flavoprotein subunit alpha [Actinobaculum suis]
MTVWVLSAGADVSELVAFAKRRGPVNVVGVANGTEATDADVAGADRAIRVELEAGIPPETAAMYVAGLVELGPNDLVLAPSTGVARAFAGAVAVKYGLPLLTGVRSFDENTLTLARFGGATLEDYPLEAPLVAIMEPMSAAAAETSAAAETCAAAETSAAADTAGAPATATPAAATPAAAAEPPATAAAPEVEVLRPEEADLLGCAKITDRQAAEVGEVDLSRADRVVAAGRGFVHKEDLHLAAELATALDAALGSSRPLCDVEGWMSRDQYLGLEGVRMRGSLLVTAGVSGAIHFTAGVAEAETIVAINNDPEAGIFEVADYGIVGDLYEVLPQLTAEIEKLR